MDKAKPNQTKTPAESREDRLKAALKANMAKRKAQARARSGAAGNKNVQKGAETDKKE